MLRRLYALFGMAVVLGYGYVDWRGLELHPSHRQFVPQGLRSHGGYRSFWYSGYHGGK
jgi:hypothetical protein